MEHYHRERSHQGLENELIEKECVVVSTNGIIKRKERLGGFLSFYHREAA